MADFESIWQDEGFEDWDDYEEYSNHRYDNPNAMPASVWVQGTHARILWEVKRQPKREYGKPRRQRDRESARVVGNPHCPKCGSVMVSRLARQGFNAGNRFWGCSSFPLCRGTRSM